MSVEPTVAWPETVGLEALANGRVSTGPVGRLVRTVVVIPDFLAVTDTVMRFATWVAVRVNFARVAPGMALPLARHW